MHLHYDDLHLNDSILGYLCVLYDLTSARQQNGSVRTAAQNIAQGTAHLYLHYVNSTLVCCYYHSMVLYFDYSFQNDIIEENDSVAVSKLLK